MRIRRLLLPVVALSLGLASQSSGDVILTTGAGQAIETVDRSARFDSLTSSLFPEESNIDLSAYTEDSLSVTVPDYSWWHNLDFVFLGEGSGGFHYGFGGNDSYVTIRTADGMRMAGLEFLIGTGNPSDSATVIWETYRDDVQTGSGKFQTTKGTIVGWSDVAGIDELRVGASGYAYTQFGDAQTIALDNLSVQVQGAAVPEPSTFAALAGLSAMGLVFMRKRRRKA